MTEKRFYEKNWEEFYYIFDSKTLPENDFEERVEYEGYDVFADSLTSKEVIDLLNENDELKKENNNLKKALWEAEENYLHEAYYDNPIRKEDKLKDLKEDFKRGYWND